MNQVKAILKSNVMLLILIALVVTMEVFFRLQRGMIMISGGTDLSVGYCMSVISVCMAVFMQRVGLAWPLAVILGLIIGVALGAFNGFASNLLRIHPMIVTLATMLIFRSISQYVCQKLPKELIGGGSSIYKLFTQKSSFRLYLQLS